jgi:hypothetical protein
VRTKVQDLQRIGGSNRARLSAIAAALAAAAAASGCSTSSSARVPVACKESPGAIQAALQRAPGDVRVGGVKLSACFARASDQADVQAVGLSFLPAAERLASDARDHPGGPAALRLGFLIGASHRGADRAQGIYSEFVRRLDSELTGVDVGSPAYRMGHRAGVGHG